MTRVHTERVRELLAAATPGPWTCEPVGYGPQSPYATGHSDAAMAQAYRDGYGEGYTASRSADAAACERYGYAPTILRAEGGGE